MTSKCNCTVYQEPYCWQQDSVNCVGGMTRCAETPPCTPCPQQPCPPRPCPPRPCPPRPCPPYPCSPYPCQVGTEAYASYLLLPQNLPVTPQTEEYLRYSVLLNNDSSCITKQDETTLELACGDYLLSYSLMAEAGGTGVVTIRPQIDQQTEPLYVDSATATGSGEPLRLGKSMMIRVQEPSVLRMLLQSTVQLNSFLGYLMLYKL